MNAKDAQIRRLTIALNLCLTLLDRYSDSSTWEEDAGAVDNANAVLSAVPKVDWTPIDEGSDVDHLWEEPTGDVYQDGVWQPELIAILEAQCVLSNTEDE